MMTARKAIETAHMPMKEKVLSAEPGANEKDRKASSVVTDVSADEADVKRELAAMCRQVFAVLDATKWGRVGLASFASVNQIDTIITDCDAPADMLKEIRAAGVTVLQV